ncbi:MAG TPA: hypothetical protein H9667_04700 [Firmicutes bacterium]|nr:hypothetical protein [Bacillota bacterium]
MSNALSYASIFQPELDKQIIQEATSGWMELNNKMVKYNGGNEVKIPSIAMDGLADYDRENGYTPGSVTLKWETQTMTQDRDRTFQLDAMDVDETNFVASAGNVMGEFQRTWVVPEVDAYRYSKIAKEAIAASKASGGYTPAESSILSKLLYDIAAVQDIVGEGTPLVVTLPITIAAILNSSEKIQKRIDVVDFARGEISTKVRAIDGIPLIPVSSKLLKTSFDFNDGKTTGQEKGGFTAAADAKTVNWIITARNAPIAVSKTDTVRVFDPMTNQKANAWKIDYRKYHDLWIPKNRLDGIFVNVKEAL